MKTERGTKSIVSAIPADSLSEVFSFLDVYSHIRFGITCKLARHVAAISHEKASPFHHTSWDKEVSIGTIFSHAEKCTHSCCFFAPPILVTGTLCIHEYSNSAWRLLDSGMRFDHVYFGRVSNWGCNTKSVEVHAVELNFCDSNVISLVKCNTHSTNLLRVLNIGLDSASCKVIAEMNGLVRLSIAQCMGCDGGEISKMKYLKELELHCVELEGGWRFEDMTSLEELGVMDLDLFPAARSSVLRSKSIRVLRLECELTPTIYDITPYLCIPSLEQIIVCPQRGRHMQHIIKK